MPYSSDSSKVVFQIPAVDTVAQAGNVEIVARILASGRSATTKPLV